MESKTTSSKTTKTNVFLGHIVHCTDLDGGDELNVEVLINEKVKADDIESASEEAAANDYLVRMNGNSFEFEYLMPSGRKIMVVTTKETTELAAACEEGKALLNKCSIG